MKARIVVMLAVTGALAVTVVTAALATPQDPPGSVTSALVARGTTGAFELRDKSEKLKLQAKGALTVDIRNVTLIPNGSTGWHGHTGPSLVVMSSGSLTMLRPGDRGNDDSGCLVTTHAAGDVFVHPEGAHDFRAGSGGATFAIVYLLPEAASPAPIDVTPAPGACS
jgi:hypothetical protein